MAKATGRPAVERHGQRRRQELIMVACRVFAAKGFDAASLQDVADEFGVLKGSLFHYIQSKDELLFEIIQGVHVGAGDKVWFIARQEDTAMNRLRRLIVAYVVYVIEHLSEVTVWLHDFNSLDESHRETIRRYEDRDRRQLAELIGEAQREGAISADLDPRLVSLALLGAMNWVHRWFRPRGLTSQEISDAFSRLFVAGLEPR